MTVAEGGGKRAVWAKFQEVYIPALKANYMVWPLVQVLNFRVMPIQFQIVRDPLRTCMRSATNVMTALREHGRYRLDSIPVPHKLSGRASDDASTGLALNDSCSLVLVCLAFGESDRIGRSCGTATLGAQASCMESGAKEYVFSTI